MSERWIVIPRWEDFQHYAERDPVWIKNHRRLLHNDAYRSLTLHQRGVLHGLWLEYAATNREIRDSTLTVTRQLGQRVTRETLEALSDAGFIEFSASKPLAARYPSRASRETEKELPLTPRLREGDSDERKTLSCRRCGASVAPRTSCSECGASPRVAGSSAREVTKPQKLTPYERAKAFTLNAGVLLEDSGFAAELAEYELTREQRDDLEELRAQQLNGHRDAIAVVGETNPLIDG